VSDNPTTVNVGMPTDLMVMLGRLDGKLDGLQRSIDRLDSNHNTHVAKVATDLTAIKIAVATGDTAVLTRVETIETRLEHRLDTVEADITRAKTSATTLRVVLTAAATIGSGLFALVQWLIPLFAQH
jgi:hypothetical protein